MLKVKVTTRIVTRIFQFQAENANVHMYVTIFERRNEGFEMQSMSLPFKYRCASGTRYQIQFRYVQTQDQPV